MMSDAHRLKAIAPFQHLEADHLERLHARLANKRIRRGEILVSEGAPAEALYLVRSGRFAVFVQDSPTPIAEIGPGEPIGEIAFFTGGLRTATVRSIRDSTVLVLDRQGFEDVCRDVPGMWRAITQALAQRLAIETRNVAAAQNIASHPKRCPPASATILLVGDDDGALPPEFTASMRTVMQADAATCIADTSTTAAALSDIVNKVDQSAKRIIFLTDKAAPDWQDAALRHADEIVFVVDCDTRTRQRAARQLSRIEANAVAMGTSLRRRLVLLHPPNTAPSNTRTWLAPRDVGMHHHVARVSASTPEHSSSHTFNGQDLARLWRFLTGTARGLVACGGGAFSSAHIGIHQALLDKGLGPDLIVGTSGGAAMGGAFAKCVASDEISKGVDAMFVAGRALSKYTVPIYSLLDHTHFDRHLRETYGTICIEDLWLPYCAVAADLADMSLALLRQGPLWQAIRASAAIPALLPPFYTADGRILIDGAVLANVPIAVMHALKRGPNMVVSFAHREAPGRAAAPAFVDYAALPGRGALLASLIHPALKRRRPRAMSAASTLVAALMADWTHFERHLDVDDMLLTPPLPGDMGSLDWRRHRELRDTAYRYTMAALSQRSV